MLYFAGGEETVSCHTDQIWQQGLGHNVSERTWGTVTSAAHRVKSLIEIYIYIYISVHICLYVLVQVQLALLIKALD